MSLSASPRERKRYVLNIGRRVTQTAKGGINYSAISDIIGHIVEAVEIGHEIVIVTTGAIAAGREVVGDLRGISVDQRWRIHYAIGQPRLTLTYRELFLSRRKTIGEILVNVTAFSNRLHYISIRETINGLLTNGMIPILNDNDILREQVDRNNDNDHLASYIAGMLSADAVIFLTDQKGVYRKGEREGNDVVALVQEDLTILNDLSVTGNSANEHILEKIHTLNLICDLGIDAIICNGLEPAEVRAALLGQNVGTAIRASKKQKLSGARKWLATGAMPKGTVIASVNGAEVMARADQRGSLLARGIEDVSGDFQKGDVVSVCDTNGRLLGYGITRYGSAEIAILRNQENVVVIHANYFFGANFEWYANKTG